MPLFGSKKDKTPPPPLSDEKFYRPVNPGESPGYNDDEYYDDAVSAPDGNNNMNGRGRPAPPVPPDSPTAIYYDDAESDVNRVISEGNTWNQNGGPNGQHVEMINPMTEYDEQYYDDAVSNEPQQGPHNELYTYIPGQDDEFGDPSNYHGPTWAQGVPPPLAGQQGLGYNNYNQPPPPLPYRNGDGSVLPTRGGKPNKTHYGTRVILDGVNTAKIKNVRGNLKPAAINIFKDNNVNEPPVKAQSEAVAEQFSTLSMKDKLRLFGEKAPKKPPPHIENNPRRYPSVSHERSPSTGDAYPNNPQLGFSKAMSSPSFPLEHDLDKSGHYGDVMAQNRNRLSEPVYEDGPDPGAGADERVAGGLDPGPLKFKESSRKIPPPPDFTPPLPGDDRTEDLSRFPWYTGSDGREENEAKLKLINQEGAFLIRAYTKRQSTSQHRFSLAVMSGGNICTLMIRQKPTGLYALGSEKPYEPEFNCLTELVTYHSKEPIEVVAHTGQRSQIYLKILPDHFYT